VTGGPGQLSAYLHQLRSELRRLGAYRPGVPASAYARVAREFLELSIPADQAAAWLAAGIGPSVAGRLVARNVTQAQWSAYAEHLRTHAGQLNGPELALEWILTGHPATEAAAWAALGYLPHEAGPLIAEGVTPAMAGIGHDPAATDVSSDAALAALRDELRRRDDLIIDPDLADRLGLDPGPPT
jgi:hypothetical protein